MNKLHFFIFLLTFYAVLSEVSNDNKNKKKKNVVDMTDAEIDKLYQEWEENDHDKVELSEDEIPLEDLPPHKRKQPGMNLKMEDLKGMNPDKLKNMQFMNKKGQPLMLIVTLNGNPTKEEAEKITSIWQTSLFNANYNFNRYLIDEKQAIFYLMDGSLAGEIKDFLIKQERCKDVTIDSQVYPGLHNSNNNDEKKESNKEEL